MVFYKRKRTFILFVYVFSRGIVSPRVVFFFDWVTSQDFAKKAAATCAAASGVSGWIRAPGQVAPLQTARQWAENVKKSGHKRQMQRAVG